MSDSLATLMALSPLDGRYQRKLTGLQPLFSEFALIKARLTVEIRWLQTFAKHPDITEIPALPNALSSHLDQLIDNFSLAQAEQVKQLEKTTNHDVKAVEYFLKESVLAFDADYPHCEFIHFGATSEDINNLAYGLMLNNGRTFIINQAIKPLLEKLRTFSHAHANVPMLARTHGQAASPTTVGKEFANVLYRLSNAMTVYEAIPCRGKFNGAVGNYNALMISYPNIDWPNVTAQFIEQLGLTPHHFTTQIEPHDGLAAYCDALARINTICLDLNRDCWGYISLNYFSQKTREGEIGSSTMPHKVNPIDFENSEGNLGIANALLHHFSEKLPVSRWQRDLSDSTVQRNLGIALGYSCLAMQATLTGLNKLILNEDNVKRDLDQHIEVLAEAIQTVMRRYGIDAPYEKLKQLTRNKTIDQAQLSAFINELDLPVDVKQSLSRLTPADYIGLAPQLVEQCLKMTGEI